jgi:hypothetical protein
MRRMAPGAGVGAIGDKKEAIKSTILNKIRNLQQNPQSVIRNPQ